MRIALADYRQLVRDGLRFFLESGGYDLVAQATTPQTLEQVVTRHEVDVVVLGIVGHAEDQIELAQSLVRQHPALQVLVIAALPVPEHQVQILAQRSVFVLSARARFDDLRDTLDDLAAGSRRANGDHGEAAPSEWQAGEGTRALTERETQILRMLAEGFRMKQIAMELDLSTKTVETHRRNLSNKLGISNIPQLTRYAVRIGLTDLSYQTV